MSEQSGRGMATRRAGLGDAHVERAEAAGTEFAAPFQSFVTRAPWCAVWLRLALERRERPLTGLALLAALHDHEDMAMHASIIESPERRSTLIAEREARDGEPAYCFDVHLQGENEKVFFYV